MRVSVFMDVEDPINPLADDAALDIARLFSEAEVRGSFCLTGDKCRSFSAKGRSDIIEAYKPHCLGLHTNGHSKHPTTMELLADLDFEEGRTAAIVEESKGFAAFRTAFGRDPVFWGGAGNTWSPEITEALKHLAIPAYSYALTRVPGDAVHRYNGVVALPQAMSISEDTWAEDEAAEAAVERVFHRLRTDPQPWLGVFVGHPTRLRHVDYWDKPYFRGRTPPGPEYTAPQAVERYENEKKNLASFLRRLPSVAAVIGVDELLDLPWTWRAPTGEERRYFKSETPEWIRGASRWPVHRPGLDPENMVTKTLALADSLEVGELRC